MVATNSSMLPISTKAEYFSLEDVRSKNIVELKKENDVKGYDLLSATCPFVIHLLEHDGSIKRNAEKGIKVLTISSNDVENYPQDSPEKMKELAQSYG